MMAVFPVICLLAVVISLHSSASQLADVPSPSTVEDNFDLIALVKKNQAPRRRLRTSSLPPFSTMDASTTSLELTSKESTTTFSSLEMESTENSSMVSPETLPPKETLQQRRKRWQRDLQKVINRVLKSMLPYLMSEDNQAKISGPCMSSLLKYIKGIQRLKLWAFMMLDATGKVPSGILTGTMTEFGAYDQCLDIRVLDKQGSLDFTGKYCTLEAGASPSAKMNIPKNITITREYYIPPDAGVFDLMEYNKLLMYYLTFRLGVCVPSKCTEEDLREIGQKIVENVDLYMNPPRCHVKEAVQVNAAQATMICVIIILLALVAAGTVVDFLHPEDSSYDSKVQSNRVLGKVLTLLTAFSLTRNFPKLMSSKTSEDSLGCLHGLRVFTIMYVILGHTNVWLNLQSGSKLHNIRMWFRDYSYEFIHNSWNSVEIFFFISGMLLTYGLMKRRDEKKRLPNFFFLTVFRYLRLTPILMFVTGLTFFLPWLSSGPFWDDLTGGDLRACHKSWWMNLLYINNWRQLTDLCLHHGWYVSSDLQLYVLGLIIIYLLTRKAVIGFCAMILTSLAGIVAVGVITYVYEFPPSPRLSIPNKQLLIDMLSDIHIRPFTHIGSYCLGMLVGYLVVKRPNMEIKPVVQAIMWCLATVITLTNILVVQYMERQGFSSVIASATYASLSEVSWTIGVAWVTFACITGRGGPVNAILSYKPLIPFSRMVYSIYMIQGLVIWTRYGSLRERFYMSHYNFIYEFFGHMVIITMLALVCYLLVESPFANLSRIIFFGNNKDEDENKDDKCSQPRSQPVQLRSLVLSKDCMESTEIKMSAVPNNNTFLNGVSQTDESNPK